MVNNKGFPNYLNEYEWEYNLVDDETINAWCMPGGKLFFTLAFYPLHKQKLVWRLLWVEAVHALADHGAQRMSASAIQQAVSVAGNVALSEKEAKRERFNAVYGISTTLGVMLPFSRSHESEADQIGLTLMAISGYNPDEAAELWKRMKVSNKSHTPEFLSTHPSNDTRINNLIKWAPQAKDEAQKFGITTFK